MSLSTKELSNDDNSDPIDYKVFHHQGKITEMTVGGWKYTYKYFYSAQFPLPETPPVCPQAKLKEIIQSSPDGSETYVYSTQGSPFGSAEGSTLGSAQGSLPGSPTASNSAYLKAISHNAFPPESILTYLGSDSNHLKTIVSPESSLTYVDSNEGGSSPAIQLVNQKAITRASNRRSVQASSALGNNPIIT